MGTRDDTMGRGNDSLNWGALRRPPCSSPTQTFVCVGPDAPCVPAQAPLGHGRINCRPTRKRPYGKRRSSERRSHSSTRNTTHNPTRNCARCWTPRRNAQDVTFDTNNTHHWCPVQNYIGDMLSHNCPMSNYMSQCLINCHTAR